MNKLWTKVRELACAARLRYTLATERAPFGVGFMSGAVVGFLVAWVL